MTLSVTVVANSQEELATTLEHEVLRLVAKGCQSGFDKNETAHYSFKIEDPQEE